MDNRSVADLIKAMAATVTGLEKRQDRCMQQVAKLKLEVAELRERLEDREQELDDLAKQYRLKLGQKWR